MPGFPNHTHNKTANNYVLQIFKATLVSNSAVAKALLELCSFRFQFVCLLFLSLTYIFEDSLRDKYDCHMDFSSLGRLDSHMGEMLAKSYGPDVPVVPTLELHIPVKYKYVCVYLTYCIHINTVITILIDPNGSWAYNNREALLQMIMKTLQASMIHDRSKTRLFTKISLNAAYKTFKAKSSEMV